PLVELVYTIRADGKVLDLSHSVLQLRIVQSKHTDIRAAAVFALVAQKVRLYFQSRGFDHLSADPVLLPSDLGRAEVLILKRAVHPKRGARSDAGIFCQIIF